MQYYTVRFYNASGFGVQYELTNVYAASEEAAKEIMQLAYRISYQALYRLYAFAQKGKIA